MASWSSSNDWIGIYNYDDSNESYLYWLYTDGNQEFSYEIIESGDIYFSPITLPTGEYEVRLFYNDSYELVTSFPFTITDSCNDIPISNYEDSFRAMSLNIWVSGQYGYGGLERIAEIIANLDIDIIGFQETDYSSFLEIQTLLENYEDYEELYIAPSEASDWNTRILSRFSIIDIYDYNLYGVGASLIIPSDDTLKFISSHLSAYPYGPYSLYEGYSIEEVLDDELMYRYQENLDIYNQIIMNPDNSPHLSVIYVGDHNTPSMLDWSTSNIKQNFGFEIIWPVSEFLLNNDFFDSYRKLHPSPYDNPGLTWSPGYPKNNFDEWDVHDRIDMIYYKHGEDKMLYPIESYAYDCDPWPSDHRAVITEFALCSLSSLGDLNADSDTNVLDVVILVNEILYPTSLFCLFIHSDIDLNEEIDILDIILLLNLILEI